MATTTNLGRVQGGGFFGSTSISETSIPLASVETSAIAPLVGDTIVNANGAVCRISSIGSSAYAVVKYGTFSPATSEDTEAVHFTPQSLSTEQQAQARANITAQKTGDYATRAEVTAAVNERVKKTGDMMSGHLEAPIGKFTTNVTTDIIKTVANDKAILQYNESKVKLGSTTLPLQFDSSESIVSNKAITIEPEDAGSYNEGLRVNNAGNNWSVLALGNDPGTVRGNSGGYLVAVNRERNRLILSKNGLEAHDSTTVTIDENNYLYERGQRVYSNNYPAAQNRIEILSWCTNSNSSTAYIADFNQYSFIEIVAADTDSTSSSRSVRLFSIRYLEQEGSYFDVSRDGASLTLQRTVSGNNMTIHIRGRYFCNWWAVSGLK